MISTFAVIRPVLHTGKKDPSKEAEWASGMRGSSISKILLLCRIHLGMLLPEGGFGLWAEWTTVTMGYSGQILTYLNPHGKFSLLTQIIPKAKIQC